jgi:hypothetical protein
MIVGHQPAGGATYVFGPYCKEKLPIERSMLVCIIAVDAERTRNEPEDCGFGRSVMARATLADRDAAE